MKQLTVEDISTLYEQIKEAVETVVCGAENTVRMLTIASLCGGHVLLEDLPGCGKTTLVKAFAKAVGCDCKRIQCTPDLMPADITGFQMLTQSADGTREMVFRKGPVFTNLLIADEINRMAPRTQSGLLECMAEKQVSCDGVTYALPQPFLVIATQNPIELQGTFPLPEAQLDRFFMRLTMGKPQREQELAILTARQTADPLDALQPVTTPETLLAAQKAVRTVRAEDSILHYLLDICDATRSHAQIRFGISTRGALALRLAAQANAAIEGRDYLLADDIQAVLPAVCAHRIHASSNLVADSKSAANLLQELLRSVEAPR